MPVAVVPGYRSILAFWLGGAGAGTFVPPQPPAGGAGYMPPSRERPRKAREEREDLERLRRLRRDDEELALLIPLIWITLWPHD